MEYYRMHTASVASSVSMSLPNPIITMIPKSSAWARPAATVINVGDVKSDRERHMFRCDVCGYFENKRVKYS
jgi:hypothetical protein